jgi:hypothetical protein
MRAGVEPARAPEAPRGPPRERRAGQPG